MDKAERIVQAIERDFTDRYGLRQEWKLIRKEIQMEIRATWTALVRKELAKDEKPYNPDKAAEGVRSERRAETFGDDRRAGP